MLNNFISLFFKPNCALCQRPADKIICRYCDNKLKTCQLKNSRELWQGDLPIFILGNYGGELKRAIANFKYDLRTEIGEVLGEWLAEAWLNCGLYSRKEKITVVPIPLHEEKQKERGFNQAELIAKRFCQITKYDLKPNFVTRIRNTKPMFELTPVQRKENVNEAFALGKDYQKFKQNSSVLILDDIYTTGTTVNEVSIILRKHKVKVLGVLAIASSHGTKN